MRSLTYEEWFTLGILAERQMYRDASVMMAAMSAATGNGQVPEAWFKAICEDPKTAERMAFEINSERLARRTWGSQ